MTELCIRSKDELRLWKELNRFKEELETKVDDSNVDGGSKVRAFNINDIAVVINNEKIICIASDREFTISRDEFRKKPRESMRKLLGSNL